MFFTMSLASLARWIHPLLMESWRASWCLLYSSSCSAAGLCIKVFQLWYLMFMWFILCDSCSSWDVSEDLSHMREGKSWERGAKKGNWPASIKLTLRGAFRHTHTHTHTDAVLIICVLWCSPAITTSNYWPAYLVTDTNLFKCSWT